MHPISIHSGTCKITDAPCCVSPSLRETFTNNCICQLYRGEVNQYNVDHLRMDILVTRRGTLTDSLQQMMLCISIWKVAYFRRVLMLHHNPTDCGWKETIVGWFLFGTCCLKLKKSSQLTFYVSVNNPVPLCRTNARRQTWNAASVAYVNIEIKNTFTYQIETNSFVLEHDTKIYNYRGCDSPRPQRGWWKDVGEHTATRACLFINSFTAGCVYTMDDYTNVCVFKDRKACYGRSERENFEAYSLSDIGRRKTIYFT